MKLNYRAFGEGPPLLILHGLFGSSDNWQTHARRYAEHYSVYLIDQRNHGQSPHDTHINYDTMADDLFELVAEMGLRDVRLIGHSMGGKTILRFAQQYSFLIDRMIVADMGIRAYPPHHDEVFKGLFAVDVDHCAARKDAESRLMEYVRDAGTLQFLLKNLYWKEPGKLAWRFNLEAIYAERENLMAALPLDRVDASTLFLLGGKSHYVVPTDYNHILSVVPHATFEVMPECGHWLHAEDPAGFIERSFSFLNH